MNIVYGNFKDALDGFAPLIHERVGEPDVVDVCELGGGANPLIDVAELERLGLNYTVMDISSVELDKAPEAYAKVVADVASPAFTPEGGYDLVFSHFLAEHVADGEQFHRNVAAMLKPGGRAIHLFPTLWTVPFIVNKLAPQRLSTQLLRTFWPRDEYQEGKFPAKYSWCYGPTKKQLARLSDAGLEVDRYGAYLGHEYYTKIPVLRSLHAAKTKLVTARPHPALTAYAIVELRRST